MPPSILPWDGARFGAVPSGWAALRVLGFAVAKGQLIGDFCMGLRGLRGPWRWLVVPGSLITIAFVLAARGGG